MKEAATWKGRESPDEPFLGRLKRDIIPEV